MKRNIFVIAAAALVLCMAACQKEENLVSENSNNDATNVRVKSTSDLHNTNWSYSVTYSEFLSNLFGSDLNCVGEFEDDTLTFGLNFDGTYAHFSFPSNIEAYGGDENGLQQIYGVSYTYSYDGATHTGYLDGVAEDENDTISAQLQFTYDDTADAITFVLPMEFADSGIPVNLTLVFTREE
ncbi:MAG: hypothetical protein K5842_05080 [Bacteroidales bacterium]|nr:hypothetical protein [Bacteroidales bacterium]